MKVTGATRQQILKSIQDDASFAGIRAAYEGLALENKGRKQRWPRLRKPCLTIGYSRLELVFGGRLIRSFAAKAWSALIFLVPF